MTEANSCSIPDSTWNLSAAESSFERWHALCEREKWQPDMASVELIAQVFGASWYFTRFIFYRGEDVFKCLQFSAADFETETLRATLLTDTDKGDTETALEQLRVNKNELMLKIFIGFLTRQIDQAETEATLTRLAQYTLVTALDIVFKDNEHKQYFAVLGMGRMAGEEMTFGSDLDIVFLYPGNSDELFTSLCREVRIFLREIAALSPAGVMYEVDTRLRPHGNSGVLITSAEAFEEYHASKNRDIWERQMMTRCRPVFDETDFAETTFLRTRSSIYREYDKTHLRTEISAMRKRVETELGTPRDKFDIKRGRGGIMDVDFITHYFQLAHGLENEKLQVPGTRKALSIIESLKLLDQEQAGELMSGYNFLKRVETCLRVYDMKSIDAISQHPKANHVIARAMGYVKPGGKADTSRFMDDYKDITRKIRTIFSAVLAAE